jgi:hypothetical protein
MAPDHPKKPFNLAVRNQSEHIDKQSTIDLNVRDKDNAQPELKPDRSYLRPRQNLAPGGTMGIRRDLPSPSEEDRDGQRRSDDQPSLKREFKTVAGRSPDDGKTHDR